MTDDAKVTTPESSTANEKPLSMLAQDAEAVLMGGMSDDEIKLHLRADLEDLLVAHSFGDPSSLAMHRYIPVEVYMPGSQDEIDFVFLQMVIALREFGHEIGWHIHSAGPIQVSSLKAPILFRTNEKLTVEQFREGFEILDEVIADALKNERKTVVRQEKEAKIKSLTAGAELARAKKFAIYFGIVGTLMTAFLASSPGSYLQIGTTRVEIESGVTVNIKHVPASSNFVSVHLGARPSAEPGKGETK